MNGPVAPEAVIGAVAAYGLPGAAGLPDGPLPDGAWRSVLDLATRERLTPLLAAAVAGGTFAVTERQREQATAAHEQAMRLCVLLERALLGVASTLTGAGIDFRVLKGPAVAHLDYPDPAQRAFGDVDILVASSSYDDAMSVLRTTGAQRRFTEVRPGFDRRWGKGACLVAPDGTQIDVHRTFVAGPFGLTIDLDELFAGWVPVEIGGVDVPALDRESRFLHGCFHAALGDRVARLVALRDVAQLALTTDLDRAVVMARAARWRADAVVAPRCASPGGGSVSGRAPGPSGRRNSRPIASRPGPCVRTPPSHAPTPPRSRPACPRCVPCRRRSRTCARS